MSTVATSVTYPSKTISTAAVLQSPGQFVTQRHEPNEPDRHQVQIKMEGCGVCGSNLPIWEGREWFTYPLAPGAPGHEGWGTVSQLGTDVRDLEIGQRVACLSYHAFATHDVADASAVVPLPAVLNGSPFPAEPLACALNVFSRCDICSGQSVAVIGVGFLGALLVQLVRNAGAQVTAISRRPFALEIAEQCGARELLQPESAELLSGRRADQFDCVIEATGVQASLDLATQLTCIRGRLVIAGYHQDGPRQINLQQWNWKGIDVINAHERNPEIYVAGMHAAIDAVASGRLSLDGLITHSFALSEINDAFAVSAERPAGFLKAVVCP